MAVIGRRAYIYPAEKFRRGMERATRGIVRVGFLKDTFRTQATGWLLTPRLVVVFWPEVSGNDTIRVRSAAGWDEDVVAAPEMLVWPEPEPEPKPALEPKPPFGLVRLKKPHGGRLDLGLTTPQIDDMALLLHFPMGTPTLSVSFGRVAAVDDVWIEHVADSVAGSSGGPLFDSEWRVIGVHCLGGPHVNKAVHRGMLLRMLQSSSAWSEIARHHRLADTVSGTRERTGESPAAKASDQLLDDRLDSLLIQAALCWSFDPARLTHGPREQLRSRVVDPTETRWSLPTRVRREALEKGGSLEELQKSLPKWRTKNVAQRVIERILAGPPYDLSEVGDDALPFWIQGAQWFSGIAPQLPSANEVQRVLERRRVRSRLLTLATTDFQGRVEQEETLRKWFQDTPPRPLVVSGLGGIGKTALLAHFLLGLPAETLILWLDFDRADLAPDDAFSVISAIAEQAKVQLEGFEPPAANEDWCLSAKGLGQQLASHLSGEASPVLVLDSFEAAQYAEKYQELWPVLEEVVAAVPSLRLIVSGRVPVEKLALAGREALSLALQGLSDDDMRTWLHLHDVRDLALEHRVVSLAKGIPLIVRLAFQLLESGEPLADIPKDLPLKIVPGYLYRRILGRLRPKFRDVAKAAIILPRMTEKMVEPVLRGVLPLPEGPVSIWFPELRKESALLTGTDILKVRQEVRSATLALLEVEDEELVKTIEAKAEKWLTDPEQDSNDLEIAAGIVYLRLRGNDLRGAGRAWRDGCGLHLKEAPELLQEKARKWLETRLGEAPAGAAGGEEPHQEATAERVKDLRSRGLDRGIKVVLSEVAARSDDSPLLFHDAYELRAAGLRAEALSLLSSVGPGSARIERDRAMLRALLHAELGSHSLADRELSGFSDPSNWEDRSEIERLALTAARIRLYTDLDLEVRAIQSKELAPVHVLSPVDVILPKLQIQLNPYSPESVTRLECPKDAGELQIFRVLIEEVRLRGRVTSGTSPDGPNDAITTELVELADRRWNLVTSTTFLWDAMAMTSKSDSGGRLAQSVLGVLALYVGDLGGLVLIQRQTPEQLGGHLLSTSRAFADQFQNVLKVGMGIESPAIRPLGRREYWIVTYMAAPEPLEALVDTLAGKLLR